MRAALPAIERVVVFCRNEERLARVLRGATTASRPSPHREAGAQDVVVTVTTSKDPVLRGEWLRDGALVCAVGANDPPRRELDNAVLERAAFVCCDSREQSRLESGDLIEPVERGVLDWLEVHELQEVVAGEVAGTRGRRRTSSLFKSNGIAAWDLAVGARVVELAREQRRRARALSVTRRRARARPCRRRPRARSRAGRAGAAIWLGRAAVRDVGVVEDVGRASRPRWCSRITYSATIRSSFCDRVKRKENGTWRSDSSDDTRGHRGRLYSRVVKPRTSAGRFAERVVDGSGRRRPRGADRGLDRAPARRRVGGRTHGEPAAPRRRRSRASTTTSGRATSSTTALQAANATLEDDFVVSEHDGSDEQGDAVPPRGAARAARALFLRPLRRGPDGRQRASAGHSRFASGIGSPCGSWVG